jgi:NADH:ubiquinone oxidoreductase subunit H
MSAELILASLAKALVVLMTTPLLAVVPALVAYAVIPFTSSFHVADINVGIL